MKIIQYISNYGKQACTGVLPEKIHQFNIRCCDGNVNNPRQLVTNLHYLNNVPISSLDCASKNIIIQHWLQKTPPFLFSLWMGDLHPSLFLPSMPFLYQYPTIPSASCTSWDALLGGPHCPSTVPHQQIGTQRNHHWCCDVLSCINDWCKSNGMCQYYQLFWMNEIITLSTI